MGASKTKASGTACCNQNCNQGRNCPLRKRAKNTPETASRLSKAEKLARRAESVKNILALLAVRRMSAADIARELGLKTTTAFAHLHHIARDLRQMRRTGVIDEQRRELWELGEDPTLPTKDELLEQAIEPKRKTVPAKQIGMGRDYLVHAFFGWRGAQGALA